MSTSDGASDNLYIETVRDRLGMDETEGRAREQAQVHAGFISGIDASSLARFDRLTCTFRRRGRSSLGGGPVGQATVAVEGGQRRRPKFGAGTRNICEERRFGAALH